MKKALSSILIVALVLTIGTISAFAASPQNGKANDTGYMLINYSDENGDGVCDSRADGGVCPQDGTGCKSGNKNGGTSFADENGDGVCDSRANGGVCPQDGTGAGRGGRHR